MTRLPVGVCSVGNRRGAPISIPWQRSKGDHLLSTIIVVLVVLWLLGMVTSYTMGGLVHILLVIAIIVVLLRVIQGRNPLKG